MDEMASRQIPPNDKNAEESVIGSMLMKRDAIVDVVDIVRAEDFYYRQYGMIFDAIVKLYNEGQGIDLVLLSNKLKSMGAPEDISRMDYAGHILSITPTAENASDYAKIVRDKAILRRMIEYMEKTVGDCYSDNVDMELLLENAEREMTEIAQSRSGGEEFASMDQVVLDVLENIEEVAKKGSDVTGIRTGFNDLDRKLTGLHPSELIIIAARPAMGKTAFALNIVLHAAMSEGVPCAFFSLEMGKEQLGTRLIAIDSKVDSQVIRTGQLVDDDWVNIMDSTYRVGGSPIIIDDTPGISIGDLRTKCRKLKKQNHIASLVIYYLQLMSGSKRGESRQQEISEISRSLKKLARELEIPIIALAQLNRAVETRDDHKPVMSDLRESGAIEQDADVIMFIHRDEVYNKESEKPGIADIIVAKQRNGSTGTIELVWLGKYTKFANKERKQKK